ncbi:hypothetical protein [Nocardia sp. XZ_19_369]|uniref:hypothetical protein n=1 Tax=Nocardia sp. XZ_19_369 TaxID=2769487 RepID=UPI00188ED58E|nr:hypothetical protein [Nocardia sp. XZ_19_369]
MTHGAEINFRPPTSRRDMIRNAIIGARHQHKDRFTAVDRYLSDPRDHEVTVERIDSDSELWRDTATGRHWTLTPHNQLQPALEPTDMGERLQDRTEAHDNELPDEPVDDALTAATTGHHHTDNDNDNTYNPHRAQLAQWHDDQLDAADHDPNPFDGTYSEI